MQQFRKAVTDSREVQEGDLFFALKGQKTDGHRFLEEIAKRGAIGAVVDAGYQGPDFGLELFRVADVLAALQEMARKKIEAWEMPIVAVTGSVGKTTTKEFIASLLATRFRVGKAPGNANSQVGLATSIINHFSGEEEILVLEMGMTHAGNISNLLRIAAPTVAVITRIGMAHAGNFVDGIEGVARAKAEILGSDRTKLAVIGPGASSFDAIRNGGTCRKILVGTDFSLEKDGIYWRVREKEGISPPFELPFTASHFLEDFLIAVAVARSLGLWWEELIPAFPGLQSTGCRFAEHVIGDVLFINDSYNAGPESVRAALDNLPAPKTDGRRIAVLGGMTVDLGPESDRIHRDVARHALTRADKFFCFGPGAHPFKEIFQEAGRLSLFTENMGELKESLFSFVRPGDVVLIKGANRYSMWKLLDTTI